MQKFYNLSSLSGKICIMAGKDDDEEVGEVIISGDPEGLESLGKLLIEFSKIDQKINSDLPLNESEHIKLECGIHIGENSIAKYGLVVSRLDTKNGLIKSPNFEF